MEPVEECVPNINPKTKKSKSKIKDAHLNKVIYLSKSYERTDSKYSKNYSYKAE